MKHAKHSVKCMCGRCWASFGFHAGDPIYAYAFYLPEGYAEAHGRHVRPE